MIIFLLFDSYKILFGKNALQCLASFLSFSTSHLITNIIHGCYLDFISFFIPFLDQTLYLLNQKCCDQVKNQGPIID